MTIRILLADDHQIVRDGIASLLAAEAGMQVVALASDGRQALAQARRHNPDIVIMDISMPGLNGIEAARLILAEMPETRVIVLSMLSQKSYVQEMLRAGVRGYLLKDCAFEELSKAIRAVNAGKVFLSADIAGSVVEGFLHPNEGMDATVADRLSTREREVLQLIAEGRSTKEIAAILCVSAKTIETHRKNIMGKLGLQNLADLIKFALREGISSLDF